MLTCTRAVIHLLLNQLKLLDVGLMKEVCDVAVVLNQVSVKNRIRRRSRVLKYRQALSVTCLASLLLLFLIVFRR